MLNDLVQGLNNIEFAKWMAGMPFPYIETDAKNFIGEVIRQDKKIKILLTIVL